MAQLFYLVRETSPIRWNWITLVGPDAQDFLHRVTTVNTKTLGNGQGASGLFLTAQGRVRAYFHLWNIGSGAYAFEFDAGPANQWKEYLLSAIDQYTFAEKTTLADLTPQLEPIWIFPEESDPKESDLERLNLGSLQPGSTLTLTKSNHEIRICHHGTLDYGRPWLTAWSSNSQIVREWILEAFPSAKSLTFSEIEKWRILALRPRVGVEINEKAIPLEIGLGDAIAENKGCYPGQEVIEKIISLGSPPRRFASIEGTFTDQSSLLPEGPILNMATPPAEIGEITSILPGEGKFTVLGLIRKIHAKEGLEVQLSNKATPEITYRGVIAKIAPIL